MRNVKIYIPGTLHINFEVYNGYMCTGIYMYIILKMTVGMGVSRLTIAIISDGRARSVSFVQYKHQYNTIIYLYRELYW